MKDIKNQYEVKDGYVIGYTARNNNKFYFDLEDFEKVKQYYWVLNSNGDIICKNEKPQLSMHKLVMGDGRYIHKNGNKQDNRKDNLVSVRWLQNHGKVNLNGYVSIYMPEHDRAFANGCVYEHILIVEEMLGRKLKYGECVHHKNRDRTDNSPSNLIVFKTNEDHTAFHKGVGIIKEGDVWIADYSNFNICPECNKNKKSNKAQMCLDCYLKINTSKIPPKEDLEPLIYAIPFTKIGEKYGVTDNTVRKWCKKYGLPFKKKDIKKLKK